jgi:hemoglobin
MAFFERLVARFYERVAADPPLRALYPEEDLGPAQRRLALFLVQYWGGPTTYQEERGHPRLRMRHAPFPIDAEQRDRWLTHMNAALAELPPTDPADGQELARYFAFAAESMRNRS